MIRRASVGMRGFLAIASSYHGTEGDKIMRKMLALSVIGLSSIVVDTTGDSLRPHLDQLAVQCLFAKQEVMGSTVICTYACPTDGGTRMVTQSLRFPATCPLYINV
jgi:hypothetical protein